MTCDSIKQLIWNLHGNEGRKVSHFALFWCLSAQCTVARERHTQRGKHNCYEKEAITTRDNLANYEPLKFKHKSVICFCFPFKPSFEDDSLTAQKQRGVIKNPISDDDKIKLFYSHFAAIFLKKIFNFSELLKINHKPS